MNIKNIIGDITEQTSGLIIHGVNSKGVMGSGVALAIRKRWPKAYIEYKSKADADGPKAMGDLQFVTIKENLIIGNGWTQLNFGNDGKVYANINHIRSVLEQAFSFCAKEGFTLKSPKIGSLRGGLDWETEVLPIFEELNKKYNTVNVEIFDIK